MSYEYNNLPIYLFSKIAMQSSAENIATKRVVGAGTFIAKNAVKSTNNTFIAST